MVFHQIKSNNTNLFTAHTLHDHINTSLYFNNLKKYIFRVLISFYTRFTPIS